MQQNAEPEPSAVLFESADELAPGRRIDELALHKLRQLGIRPARICSDSVFLRRAYLDVIGVLPTPDEAREFLADRRPDRRRALIERLLQRDEFADYWALKWGDLLRVKAEFPINLWPNAAQAYHRWILAAIRQNLPYDRFVRDLLTASGSNFRDPQANFYRAMQSRDPHTIARMVALTFLGERVEKWPKARLEGFAGFFAQLGYKPTGEWKEEIVYHDLSKPARSAIFPDGKPARIPPGTDPRLVLADWLLAPGNPWLARTLVNRAWSWLFGRGIVHEPDDLRPDNPPANPELLSYLERAFAAGRYDMKQLFRLVLNSGVYQLSPVARASNPAAVAQFASYPVRRLEAEVLLDALNQVTGATDSYSSQTPEPYTFIPEDQRSVALADGSITSPFLEMFGRPPRDTGLEAERSNRSTAAQRLHLLNSSHIKQKIERGPTLAGYGRTITKPDEVVDGLYLTILSRYPSTEERAISAAHYQRPGVNRRDNAMDLAWALVNSAEFLCRH